MFLGPLRPRNGERCRQGPRAFSLQCYLVCSVGVCRRCRYAPRAAHAPCGRWRGTGQQRGYRAALGLVAVLVTVRGVWSVAGQGIGTLHMRAMYQCFRSSALHSSGDCDVSLLRVQARIERLLKRGQQRVVLFAVLRDADAVLRIGVIRV